MFIFLVVKLRLVYRIEYDYYLCISTKANFKRIDYCMIKRQLCLTNCVYNFLILYDL